MTVDNAIGIYSIVVCNECTEFSGTSFTNLYIRYMLSIRTRVRFFLSDGENIKTKLLNSHQSFMRAFLDLSYCLSLTFTIALFRSRTLVFTRRIEYRMSSYSIICSRNLVKFKNFPSTRSRYASFQIHSMIYKVYAYLVRLN